MNHPITVDLDDDTLANLARLAVLREGNVRALNLTASRVLANVLRAEVKRAELEMRLRRTHDASRGRRLD